MSATVVQLSNVVIPEVYLSYTAINDPEKSPLMTSGAIARSPLLDGIARTGGVDAKVPYWKDIDPTIEPNYSNDDPADKAEPRSITSGRMNTRKAFVNQGFSEMDLVQELAGASPMQHIRNRFGTYWTRQQERRLSAIISGIYLANVAKNGGDMVLDVTGNDADSAFFTSDNFVDAAYTMGDEVERIGTVIVHSQIAAQIEKSEDYVKKQAAEGQLSRATYKGRNLVVTDNPYFVSGTGKARIYTTILLGAGSVGFGSAGGTQFAIGEGIPKVEAEVERDPRSGNGGGQETIWERKTWIMHPFGFNWTEPTGGDALTEFSPKLSDLAKAAPWTRFVARKQVPIAFLRSYGVKQAA